MGTREGREESQSHEEEVKRERASGEWKHDVLAAQRHVVSVCGLQRTDVLFREIELRSQIADGDGSGVAQTHALDAGENHVLGWQRGAEATKEQEGSASQKGRSLELAGGNHAASCHCCYPGARFVSFPLTSLHSESPQSREQHIALLQFLLRLTTEHVQLTRIQTLIHAACIGRGRGAGGRG